MDGGDIQVERVPGGGWIVTAGGLRPLSLHSSETEAERVAVARAVRVGTPEVIVKDAYHRLHRVRVPLRA